MAINGPKSFRNASRRVLLAVSAVGLMIVASAWFAGRLAEQKLSSDLQRRLEASLDVHASGLIGDLAEYPAALTLLSSDPRILRAVVVGDAIDLDGARDRLRQFADLSGVDRAMLVEADGKLIVDHDDDPSTAKLITDWLMRQPAFDSALKSGLGRAFGTATSGDARLYVFARRIENPGQPPALLIVALSLEHTELLWRLARQEILVIDRDGVVLLSSDRERLFERLGAEAGDAFLDGQRRACREGAAHASANQICRAKSIARLDWDIYLLAEMAPVRDQALLVQWVTALGMLSTALLIGVIWQRRLSMQRALQFKEEANQQLQKRVELRTGELGTVNSRLQVEIDERIAKEEALQKAQAELVQASKLAALGQLSAGIAHELNQPLAALRAYADNARTFLARGHTETASENLLLIGDLTERIAKITKDLKVLARRQPAKTERVMLPPLVRSVIEQIQKTVSSDTIDIVYDRLDVALLAEPVGLQQVLGNILQNGIDAMEPIDANNRKTITITTTIEDGHVRLAIADDGPGIDPEVMDSIFDPFFTTKDVGKGLGLGLSLSASIVQDMGGRLSAANRDGGGACFTVELDIVPDGASSQESAAA